MADGYIPVSELKLFNLADAKTQVSEEKTRDIKNEAGTLDLGIKSLDWISSLPPEMQVHAYSDFRQHMSKMAPEYSNYIPDVQDPAQISDMAKRLKWGALTQLERLQAQHLQAATAKEEAETGLLPENAKSAQNTPGNLAMKAAQGDETAKSALGFLPQENDTKLRLVEMASQREADRTSRESIAKDNQDLRRDLAGNKTEPAVADARKYREQKKKEFMSQGLSEEDAEKKAYETEKGIAGVERTKVWGDIKTLAVQDPENPDRAIPVTANELNQMIAEGKRPTMAAYNPDIKEAQAEASQRGGARSAQIETAGKVFDLEKPELIALRNKVQQKGLLPGGDEIKDINAINLWAGKKTSDPDVAELQKKTTLLADTLQKTIGGAQGGEWAFEVARDILDPSYNPEAFTRIMESHSKTIKRLAGAYSDFGKTSAAPPQAPGRTNKAPGNAPPANILKEGVTTIFKNGQKWKLQNGQPVQVQ